MKSIFWTCTSYLLFYTVSIAGTYPDWELKKYYGFHFDTLSFPEEELRAIAMAESVYQISPWRPGWHLYARTTAYFDVSSCLAFYELGEDSAGFTIDVTGPEHPNRLIFFNHCNKSIYCFGDSVENFNAVFKDALLSHFDSISVLNLIQFFLATRHTVQAYQILWTPQNFVELYDSLYSDLYSDDERIRSEKDSIPPMLDSIRWKETGDGYKVTFYAWGGPNSVIFWNMKITRDGIQIKEEKRLFTKLGTWAPIR